MADTTPASATTETPVKKPTTLGDIGFSKLSDVTYLLSPSSSGPASDSAGPTNILICGWTGAGQRPLIRYITPYRELYPSANIIVIFSLPNDFVLKSVAQHHAELRTMQDALKANPGPTLLHIFSNGGIHNYTQLISFVANEPDTNVKAVIIDSAPGKIHFSNMTRAISVAASNYRVIQWAMAGLVYGIVAGFHLKNVLLTGNPGKLPIDVNWEKTTGGEIIPTTAKRLYIYSEEDEMVYASDIKSHAEKAKENGIEVVVERFDGSKHVCHAVKDGDRYWGIISRLWNDV